MATKRLSDLDNDSDDDDRELPESSEREPGAADGPEPDDEGDSDEPEETAAEAAERKTRNARRRERREQYESLQRRSTELEETQRRLQSDLEYQRQQNLLLQQQQLYARQQNEPAPQNPYADKLEAITQRQLALQDEFNRLSPAEQNAKVREYQTKYQQIEAEKHKTYTMQTIEELAPRLGLGQHQQPQVSPHQAALRVYMLAEFGDLFPQEMGGRNAKREPVQYWNLLCQQKAIEKGFPINNIPPEVMKECAEETRVRFKMATAKRPPVTAAERERFTGRSAAGGDAAGGGPRPLSPAEKNMARKAFPHLSEKAAYKEFQAAQSREAT